MHTSKYILLYLHLQFSSCGHPAYVRIELHIVAIFEPL